MKSTLFAYEPLERQWQRLKLRWRRSPARGLLDWWLTALASWVPSRWLRLLSTDRAPLWLIVEGDRLELRLDDETVAPITLPLEWAPELPGRLDPDAAARPRRLLLPADRALRCRLVLPEAAAERLRDVVAFEIDRQTPFQPDQVVYDARVLDREPGGGQISVELVVVPKARLDATLAPLGALGEALEGVDVAGPDGPLGINLLPPERRQYRFDPALRINLALLLIALSALWFTLWQTLENRREAVERLQATIGAERQEARQVASLRQRLEDAAEGAGFLVRQRAARPPVIDLLEDMSRRLPDATALERLNLNGNRLVIIGYSSEAPATVARLQDSPYLRSPALSGAVQPDRLSGRDRFTLTADVAVPADGVADVRP